MPDMLPPQKVLKAGSPKGKRIREPSKGKKYTSKYSKCQELGHNIRSYSVLTTDSNKKQKKGDQNASGSNENITMTMAMTTNNVAIASTSNPTRGNSNVKAQDKKKKRLVPLKVC